MIHQHFQYRAIFLLLSLLSRCLGASAVKNPNSSSSPPSLPSPSRLLFLLLANYGCGWVALSYGGCFIPSVPR